MASRIFRMAVGPSVNGARSRRYGGGSSSSYDPLTLFAGGREGFWYDYSDLSTLFQERTGASATTPAGVDDPVGTVLDKSGNENHAWAGADAARPILRYSDGLYWLDWDGVDDHFLTAAIDFTGTDKMTVFSGYMATRNSGQIIMELSVNSISNLGSWQVSTETGGESVCSVIGDTSYSSVKGAAYPLSVARVHTAIFDIAAASRDTECMQRTNAADDNAVRNGLSDDDGGNFGSYPLYICARAGTTAWFQGRTHQIIGVGASLSADEIREAELYVADKTGVVLS